MKVKVKSLSCVRFFVTPWTTQTMEFSRLEYWSGEPFPSPEDLPNPGIKRRSPALQADSLLAGPPEKPKKTGVGSLSLLRGIFLTLESNQGLLHCRQILYQLIHQGNLYINWELRIKVTFLSLSYSVIYVDLSTFSSSSEPLSVPPNLLYSLIATKERREVIRTISPSVLGMVFPSSPQRLLQSSGF